MLKTVRLLIASLALGDMSEARCRCQPAARVRLRAQPVYATPIYSARPAIAPPVGATFAQPVYEIHCNGGACVRIRIN